MYKTLSVILTCLLALAAFACAGSGTENSNNSNANAIGVTNVDPKNMPPGLSASPLPINGTTPGIPDPSQVNVNMNVKGATPTPGIPDPKNVNKIPKGATPTPGIPSPEEIRKMKNATGNQSIQMQTNPSLGNAPRNSMKQMQPRNKP